MLRALCGERLSACLRLRLCLRLLARALLCLFLRMHLRPRVEFVCLCACVCMRVARHWHRVRVTRVRVGETRTRSFLCLPADSPFSFPHSLACTLHNVSLSVIGAAFGRTGSKGVVVPSPRFDGVNYQPHPWCFSLWCFSPTSLSLLVSP